MKKFLSPNIDGRGRASRAAIAVLFLIASATSLPYSRVAAVLLFGSALFVGFEALRGWCVLRACGIKTKL